MKNTTDSQPTSGQGLPSADLLSEFRGWAERNRSPDMADWDTAKLELYPDGSGRIMAREDWQPVIDFDSLEELGKILSDNA